MSTLYRRSAGGALTASALALLLIGCVAPSAPPDALLSASPVARAAAEAPPLPARSEALPNPEDPAVLLPTPTPAPPPAPATATPSPVALRDWGPAPELTNDTWLNSEPLRLADLRGKVVLIEFWTYG
jgi:hypothetical protein